MKKIFDVARHEYLHHVGKRRFWVALLGIPIGFLAIMGLSFLFSYLSFDREPVGYIDQANLITHPQEVPEKIGFMEIFIELIPYTDEQEALIDTENGILQGYVVIPEGYQSTFQVTYYSNKQPTSDVTTQINRLLRDSLLRQEQIPNLARINEGSNITLESLDGSQTSDGTGWHRIIVPALVGILYFVLVMSSSGYLLQSLVEEKQNRTMEIMITSMTPNQLMIGKIIGNLAVGFTQIVFWIVIIAVGLLLFGDRIPFLSEIEVSAGFVMISFSLMYLSFVVAAGLFAIIGATMSTMEEAQSVTGMLVLPMMLPFYFFQAFLTNPNGVIPKIFSYFPLSAPMSLSLRLAFTTVPAWEIVLVYLVQVASIVLVFWLSGKAFKRGLLEYNKRIKLRDLFVKEVSNG